MKHLSSILLSIGVILSVVAIILPQWTVEDSAMGSTDAGLFEVCIDAKNMPPAAQAVMKAKGLSTGCQSLSSVPGNPPKDILVSQILSIVGTVGLAVGAVMCMMMKPRYSKLAAGLGVACLTAVLIVYATVTNSKDNGGADLGASYWLELSAAVVGLIGLFVPAAKK